MGNIVRTLTGISDMTTQLYFLHAMSAIHVGSGQGVGAIDLPHAREVATNFPYAPGSGMKGVLRAQAQASEPALATVQPNFTSQLSQLFGAPESGDKPNAKGTLHIDSASLLCLPMETAAGVFAWVSCPTLLRRLQQESAHFGWGEFVVPVVSDSAKAVVGDTTGLKVDGHVYLRDFRLTPEPGGTNSSVANWIAERVWPQNSFEWEWWRADFVSHFAVVHDAMMKHFCQTALDVRPRIVLSDSGVAENLWFEENLPLETILWGKVAASTIGNSNASDSMQRFKELVPGESRLQIGGKATIGHGDVRWLTPVKPVTPGA